MIKRIQSFLITAASILVAALATVVYTPQWNDFVQWVIQLAGAHLATAGVSATVVGLLGVGISELVKAVINKIMAQQEGYPTVSGAKRAALRNSHPDFF